MHVRRFLAETQLRRGTLLVPSFYMAQNGKQITALVLDVNGESVYVHLNNGKTSWYDIKTILDLFTIA